MRNIVLIGLGLLGLTACQTVQPPSYVAAARSVWLSPAVVARCGTVTWSDTSFIWSNGQLTNHNEWKAGIVRAVPTSDQKNIVLSGTSYRLVSTDSQNVPLDSTFTCTKTGEVLKVAYTFPGAGASAKIFLDVQNGALVGQWEAFLPPA